MSWLTTIEEFFIGLFARREGMSEQRAADVAAGDRQQLAEDAAIAQAEQSAPHDDAALRERIKDGI